MSVTDDLDRDRLITERDFLLRSLDDLDAEHAAGNIDEESYRALHDDYTARAASVIRVLRDGVDARPAPQRVPLRRRVVIGVVVLAFAGGASAALALALGSRLPGETSSGNSSGPGGTLTAAERRRRLEEAVRADPDDITSRLLLARFVEADGDLQGALEQYDAVIAVDTDNVEAHAHAGRILYAAAQQAATRGATAGDAALLVDRAMERLDRAVAIDPGYADARFFRAIVLANEFGDFEAAQNDLQRYLVLDPDGVFGTQARELLAQVTEVLEASAGQDTQSP